MIDEESQPVPLFGQHSMDQSMSGERMITTCKLTTSKLESELGDTPKMPSSLRARASVSVNTNRLN